MDYNGSDNNSGYYTPYRERPETYIVPLLFALIFIIGVVGNGTLVAIFARHKTMRNAPNTYIFCLALADLLVIITCVPFTSIVYTLESWPWGDTMCRVSEAAKDISIGVSVFTLTALSADRYLAIVDPLRNLHATGIKRATRLTITTTAGIWILSAALSIPAFISSNLRVLVVNSTTQFSVCNTYPEEWEQSYVRKVVLIRFLVYYLLPLAVIAIFYILMARHLVLSTRSVPGETPGTRRQMKTRKKVALTVLAFVLVFAACFLPLHVFLLWFYFCPTAIDDYNMWWHGVRIVGFCLSFLNSCVNPIALYCTSSIFRKHFNRYSMLSPLCQIGSRPNKHWSTIHDNSIKTDRLLILMPLSSSCPLEADERSRCLVRELLHALHHPYISPVLQLEARAGHALAVLPYNQKGSLEDLIYKSTWSDDYSRKYSCVGVGLPPSQVASFGRQILEGLLFLKEKGLPPFQHLHTGNVVIQNGVTR